MSKPEDIPQDVWDAARHALSDGFTTPIPNKEMAERAARAIMAAKKEELEACAQVAVEIAAGRMRQSHEAKAANKRAEFRDFESMSMSATDVAFAIRKRGNA